MSPTGSGTAANKCGLFEWLVFIGAIAAGTACSITSKTMMELHGIGPSGERVRFGGPIFQTFGMFVGMLFGLIMHWAVLYFKLPFPGYDHSTPPPSSNDTKTPPTSFDAVNGNQNGGPTEKDRLLEKSKDPESQKTEDVATGVPIWMYYFLVIPSIFDLAATALCMMGLLYLDVSIYIMLRGSGIIFVALMKQHVLGNPLFVYQWIGVFWNVVSVFLIGATAILNSSDSENTAAKVPTSHALLGVLLVLAGAFVQALQFVFEEKVMNMDDSSAPPLLLIGMEGFWGTVLCVLVVYPLAYFLPGDDNGSYENPFTTYGMFMRTETIQVAFLIYFFTIFAYNLLAVLVTYMLNSVWHAILDNFRPMTVWGVDMFIFYVIYSNTGEFGEPWTKYSFLQLIGMFILLFGTAVYNAPNGGSIKLLGQWWVCCINLSQEYEEVELEIQERQLQTEWEERQKNFKSKRHSSLAERSPLVSIHTQAHRGLASSKS